MRNTYQLVIGIMIAMSAASQASLIAYDGFNSSALGDKPGGVYKNNFSMYATENADVKGGAIIGLGTYNWSGNSATFKASAVQFCNGLQRPEHAVARVDAAGCEASDQFRFCLTHGNPDS